MKELIAIKNAKLARMDKILTAPVQNVELKKEFYKLMREVRALDLVIRMGK